MSASGVSTDRMDRKTGSSSGSMFEAARWLAWRDVKRSWKSYPASALALLFFGFLAISVVSGAYEASAAGGARFERMFGYVFADFFFAVMSCVIVTNWISLEYLKVWSSDVFSEKTAFLKSMPISTSTIVSARVISMLVALPLNTLALFLPAYLFTDFREMGFAYLWFVGIWLGWSLLYAGPTMLCELGLSGRVYMWASFPIVAVIILSVLVIDIFTGSGLIVGAANIATSGFGAVVALVSIAIGFAGFLAFAKLTVRVVDRREVGS